MSGDLLVQFDTLYRVTEIYEEVQGSISFSPIECCVIAQGATGKFPEEFNRSLASLAARKISFDDSVAATEEGIRKTAAMFDSVDAEIAESAISLIRGL